MTKQIEDRPEGIIALCKIHAITSIALFGSAANNTMSDNSDIDFLVQFEDDIDVFECG